MSLFEDCNQPFQEAVHAALKFAEMIRPKSKGDQPLPPLRDS